MIEGEIKCQTDGTGEERYVLIVRHIDVDSRSKQRVTVDEYSIYRRNGIDALNVCKLSLDS